MSSTIRSLKPPSWLTEFRSFIMRGILNLFNVLHTI